MIYLRADANKKTGTGHVMRCLSIAKKIKESGAECKFIMAESSDLVSNSGFETLELNTDWQDMESELPALKKILGEKNENIILIDSYYVTEKYIKEARKYSNIAYLDDFGLIKTKVDLLINYNVYADKLDYSFLQEGEKLIGCKFAPLRDSFANLPKKDFCNDVKDILITTGGTDFYNAAGILIKKAIDENLISRFNFHVVAGIFNKNIPELNAFAAEFDSVKIYKNVSDMAGLMCKCDLAVSAAGSTLYELCACAVPTICYVLADNQMMAAEAFSDMKLMRSAGDIRNGTDKWAQSVFESITELASNRAECLHISNAVGSLVDAKGAYRVAKKILGL